MKVLIVAATQGEIEPLISKLGKEKVKKSRFFQFSDSDHDLEILITGAGMVATSYQMGKLLAKKNYDLAINLGIAGAFDRSLSIGSVVRVTSDRFPELGAEDGANFLSLSDLDLVSEEDFPLNKSRIENSSELQFNTLNKLKQVSGITVNLVHGSAERVQKTLELFNPQTESMEGAAFLYACMVENLKCVQIRAVSNFIERRSKENWNIPLAVKNLNETAQNLLKEIKKSPLRA